MLAETALPHRLIRGEMAGLGPMHGQAHHFARYAPEPVDPYALQRYTREAERLLYVISHAGEISATCSAGSRRLDVAAELAATVAPPEFRWRSWRADNNPASRQASLTVPDLRRLSRASSGVQV
jgi:hypothetical protein